MKQLSYSLVLVILTGSASAQGDCGSATAIPSGNQFGIPVNTIGGTASGVTPTCGGTAPIDTWFSWSPTLNSDHEFSLCNTASFDTRLALYSACGGTELLCNDDFFGCAGLSSLLQVPGLLAANTYFLQVGGFNAVTGTALLDISAITLSPPLVNDTCATATTLAAGASITPYDTTGAQDEATHIHSCSASANPHSQDVWYSWTPDVSGSWSFSLCGSSYDSLIQVWDGCAGALLGCNDNACGAQSEIGLSGLVAGTPYLIQLGGFNRTNAGAGTLDITMSAPGGDCSTGAVLADGSHVGIAIDTTLDAPSGVTPACGAASPMVDTWFSWSPTLNSDHEFSLCNTASFDSRMALYSACGAAEIACNDDFFGCANFTSRLQVPALLDANTYYLQVGGYNAATGTGQLDIGPITLSPPLANDTCATATALAAGASITAFDTSAAQDEGTQFICSASANPHSRDVWYSWTPDVSGAWRFSLCGSSFNTAIQVWDGCAGAILGCNNDACGAQSILDLGGLVAGTPYYIQVGGFNRTAAGTGALDISVPPPGPANDDCATATALPSGAQVGVISDTSTAMASGVLPSCGGATPPNDIWYSWSPGSSGDWQFSTCNAAGYDSRLALFSSCGGAEIACNDDGAGCGLTTVLDAPGLSGSATYFIQVGGFNAASGTSVMDIVQTGVPVEPGADYCPLTPNSAGAGADMSATGSNSVALNDLTIVCTNCPAVQPGVFFYGPSQIMVPFGEGNRCVGGTVIRLWPPIQTNASGAAVRAVDNSVAPNLGIVSGANLNFQFWFRDPAGGGSGFNLTNGYSILFTP